MTRLAAILMLLLATGACGGGGAGSADGDGGTADSAAGDGGDVPTTPIVFETVEKGAQGPTEERTIVARTQAEFDEAWRGAGGAEPPALTGVDFATEMVIGVFQGQQPTAGYDIEITSVGPEYLVTYETRRPAEGCMTAQVLTAPFHVVSVPASAKRPSFAAEEGLNPC